MSNDKKAYERILAAVDFSSHSAATVKQAAWVARQSKAHLVLAHALPDFARRMTLVSAAARQDAIFGEGTILDREIRQDSDARLQKLIEEAQIGDLDVAAETLIGEPYLAITHAVQQQGFDLVVAGSLGQGAWERLFIGSTAKRLIRKCPASVWLVADRQAGPPRRVLMATDFSEASRKAALQGHWIARQANAELHLLHAIDSFEVPEELLPKIAEFEALRRELEHEARGKLREFVASIDADARSIQQHVACGPAWHEIDRVARNLKIDLLVMGTVGRGGISGLLLGNTAEKVLDTCHRSILTVKPDGYVSPIQPPFWRS
jgi:nucleotide-binding universal stress UspA family protein